MTGGEWLTSVDAPTSSRHECELPLVGDHKVGHRWRCADCSTVWRVYHEPPGARFLEWTYDTGAPVPVQGPDRAVWRRCRWATLVARVRRAEAQL